MALGIGPHNGNAANQVVNTDITTAGASGPGGLLSEQKDAKNPSTDPKFGEIMKQFQTVYGAKPEKAREIKKTLGKDDFLKIMITQMKNQDPSKPFNADEMAAQMAQYASVEQLQNVNQNIQKLSDNNKVGERMAMTGMIGKIVTVDRERFPHVEGQNESLAYALPRDAASVKLTVLSEAGEPILEKDLGPQKKGEQSFSWDGAKSNTIPSKSGTYIFKISAQDAKGLPIQTNPQTKGKVIGVGFEGADPFFLVGDAHSHQKVTMKNIIEVDEDRPAQMALPMGNPVAIQAQGGVAPPAEPGSNFFSFKKGEGSQGLDPTVLSPEAQAALARYQAVNGGEAQPAQQQLAAAPSSAASTAGAMAEQNAGRSNEPLAEAASSQGMGTPSGKGFPSGLTDSGNDTMDQKGVMTGE